MNDIQTIEHDTGLLVLSFAGVRVASLPLIDELLAGLQSRLAARPKAMLVAYAPNASVREHLVTALQSARHGSAGGLAQAHNAA